MTSPRQFHPRQRQVRGTILVSPSQAHVPGTSNGRNGSLPGETRLALMTNSLFSSAALMTVLLCGMPVLAQQSEEAAAPVTPPDSTVAASSETTSRKPPPLTPASGSSASARSPARYSSIARLAAALKAPSPTCPSPRAESCAPATGVAEVEFEDNSSLRLTPNSIVEFPVLSMGQDGTRASTIHVLQGTIFVSLTKAKAK